LEDLRRRLDPRVAQSVPPHITIIYDDEAPDAGLLHDRLREACPDFAPLALQLGGVAAFAPPAAGLYVAAQADATFDALRARVLRPPFAPRGPAVRPHVTLLHPRSVADAPADWQCHAGSSPCWRAIVREVTVIQSDGGPWRVRATIPLGRS
jgi:2'-5' RNA ligase